MQVNLNHRLFSEDPGKRFSKQTGLEETIFNELWRMYKWNGLNREFLVEWLFLKHHYRIPTKTLNNWFLRKQLFNVAQTLIKKGVRSINIEYFQPYQMFVLFETNRNEYKQQRLLNNNEIKWQKKNEMEDHPNTQQKIN